ncbi:MAG: Lrp/AsnC family transcriptional regulator [Candidatus Bathyarchaeota archaeon]|nr:Lrp/AsnC family transcriptional regulator [Candidatus Bathyarchaeota archaeon]MDH5787808.1 Lrp/AsnC family transcriptional regulator [Candidatus Bathyarchaeota archaeon]
MKELKSLDYKILWELIKNSRRSDRELAKVLKISQPTVTRRRSRIEAQLIEGYTAIPKWEKIGFELIAFTFVKTNKSYSNQGKGNAILSAGKAWIMKQPNIAFALPGEGLEWDGLIMSYHKNYSDYAHFKLKLDQELSEIILESRSFIATITEKMVVKPLHFKYLAEAK